jgi:glycosyltransferase involved in cell wall biosynthesis
MRRVEIRGRLQIPDAAVLALYLGRLNRDKGVLELASAFVLAAQRSADLHLLLVGPDEAGVQARIADTCSTVADRVHFLGYTSDPEAYMAAADFFVLPSHREGFGSSVIEAAACGIPAIGSRIYGLTDAIVEEKTGLLVPVGDIGAIANAMLRLAMDREYRLVLGKQGLARAREDFGQQALTNALLAYYAACAEPKADSR